MHDAQAFDLYTLMDHYHQGEILNDYTCSQCGSQNSTVKTLSIIALPRVLVIHLSRFRGLHKIDSYVRFPAQASIKYKIDNNVYNTQYRITGIVVHKGPSIAQGHYISYVRAGETWFKADDGTITGVLWSTVCRKRAYMLFYEQF